MKHVIHPAANIFPLMGEAELSALAADIKENGQREPATFWCDQLIDGRNRALACELIGRELDACELDPDTDPVKWSISHNLHRRHLTKSQLAMVGERLAEYYAGLAKGRQKEHGHTAPGKAKTLVEHLPQVNGKSRDAAGAAVGVSGKLIDAAKVVRANGSPELIAKVESGKATVTKAALVAASVPKAEQVQAVDAKQPKPERTVYVQLRQLFDRMTTSERKHAACMWEDWLGED